VEFEDLLLKIDVTAGGKEGQFLDLFFQLRDGFFKFQVFLWQVRLPMNRNGHEPKYRSGFPAPVSKIVILSDNKQSKSRKFWEAGVKYRGNEKPVSH